MFNRLLADGDHDKLSSRRLSEREVTREAREGRSSMVSSSPSSWRRSAPIRSSILAFSYFKVCGEY